MNPTDLVYGRRPVWEVLRAGKRSLHKLWMVPGTAGGVVEEILHLARKQGVPIEWVKRDHLDRMVRGHHQGIAAQAAATQFLELDQYLKTLSSQEPHPASGHPLPMGEGKKKTMTILGLDEIEDPQNIGAILRNAGFFGVDAVLVPRWRSAPVGDTALRASSGAAEHVQLIRVRNLVQAMDELKEHGFEVWGAEMGGETLGRSRRPERVALILGSEGKGLRRLVREHCDRLVGIQGAGKVGSLNVAATSAIFLHQLFSPNR